MARESEYLISIVRKDGEPVYFKPRSQELHDFGQSIVNATLKRQVGVLATRQAVGVAVAEAIEEVMRKVTSEVRP